VQMRRMMTGTGVISGILLATSGAALWYASTLPGRSAAPVRLDLNHLPANIEERNTILQGVLQQESTLRYSESIGGNRLTTSKSPRIRHTIVPLTPSSWSPGQPVRFLLHIESPHTYTPRPVKGDDKTIVESEPGLLLRGSLPAYLRRIFEHKGLVI